MSQRTDASPTPPNPLPKVDEKPLRSSSWRSSRRLESNDKPDRRRSLRMSEGRDSGELEGSTLGSSSRDGDKGGRGSRRTHSSGGFLLDSSFLPRSSSLRHSYHRAHHSESERKEKRGTPPDSEIVVPKKRSRFPWSRQKESTKESSAAPPGREASQETPGPSHSQDAEPHLSQTTEVGSEAPLGLDRDSLQIVNLALNLSESRRVSAHGRVPSGRVAGGRWTASTGQPSVSSSGKGAPIALGSQNDSPYPRRSFTQMTVDDHSKLSGASHVDQAVHAPSSVLNLLPDSANSNSLPHVFSDGTLARADKARRHFELFSEYLRLLPSLSPLKPHEAHTDPDSTPAGTGDTPPGRSYNPLQSIRNRKVRFRERCPIDTDAEGWTNVGKVHEWVDSIESQFNQEDRSSFECLKLPPFHQGSKDLSHKEPEDDEIIGASPSSSLRRTSRASSVKARRPKSDWMISPPELLADIAWVENIQNKSKLIDKDGNNLYPDPAMLIPSDALKTKTRNIQEELPSRRESVDTDQPTSRTSLSDAHPGLTPEFKRIGRGRRRHRFQGPSHIVRSSGGRHKLRRRSSSSSSASSRGDKQYWKYQGESVVSPRRSTSLRPEPSRTTGYIAPPDEESSLDMKAMSPQRSNFQRSWKASDRTKSQEQRESISSAPSVDDRYDRLTYSVTADGRVPLTPIQSTFFPSIASNLSPPSSRSPSPSKGRFPRTIIARRERSKSNSRAKDAVDNSSLESEVLRSNSLSEYSEGLPHAGRLDPSPLPDQTPSTHQDGRIKSSQQARKGLAQHESKLRGIFKGPGKIAEKVGNEVSKMGGLILKKDTLAHSRQSSFESHVTSDDEIALTDAEESKGDKTTNTKASLRRLPTFSEDYSLAARREPEKAAGKDYLSAPLPFTSPSRQSDQSEGHRRSDLGSPQKTSSESEMKSARDTGRDEALSPSPQKRRDVRKKPGKVATFGPELHTIREQIKKGRIKDPSVPYSLTRPPITGLAQAKASHEPSSHESRSTPSSQSRSWSISERSVSTSMESGVPAKREVERTRALLLSSGIKAREITRRAHTVRSPPPEFLRRAIGPDTPVPEVPRSHEFDLAIQALVKRFENSEELFQRSMDGYPGDKLSALSCQLGALEDLVNNSLNPRVRAAAQDAEDLSVQLNTTSTLAVKQLSDTLDKGIRRRHRRLRWIRRTGFVMLEWALVGILWWVWLIVMAFKLLRGVFRGAISGVRWVLWL